VKLNGKGNSLRLSKVQFRVPEPIKNPALDNHLSLPSFTNLASIIGRSLTVLGAFAIVFLVQLVLVSHVSQSSAQFKALETFRYELANGTAPVGQVDAEGKLLNEGTPVAIIKIEKLGLQQVVLEGTNSKVTLSGPGHRRDTVLPGQAGISVIYGRQAAYGAPFANVQSLKAGDKITAITGQGESTYTVTQIRKAGDEATNALGDSKGRLTLVTAGGTPYLPSEVVRVEATLASEAFATPNRVIVNGAIPSAEKTLGSNLDALTPLIYLTQLLIVILIFVFWLVKRWGKVQGWLAGAPVLIWLGSIWSELVIQLLPNLI
jgi:LPXTG-site transpeptidase (sortase) family protein